MKICRQITSGVESQCGKNVCCKYCDDPCNKKCDKEPETCGYLDDTENSVDGALINPNVDAFVSKFDDTLTKIKQFEIETKKIEAQESILRAKLLKAMEDYKMKSFENDYIKLTYVAPYKRTKVDGKKLKAEQPEVYEKYTSVSDVKASIKIEVK